MAAAGRGTVDPRAPGQERMFKAQEPFTFFSRLHLIELTALKAATIPELLAHLKTVSGSSIYHHTHHFIQRHQYLSPEPPNDFAYWISEVLGERALGEKLASIDLMLLPTIRSIREKLIETIEEALKTQRRSMTISAPEGEEFSFLKSVSFIFPTPYRAEDLGAFAECLGKVSISSIYYHMFEARLRLERPTNDFSNWLSGSVGETQLAVRIAQLDPYTQTGEGLRATILRIVEKRLSQLQEKGS